MYSVGIPNFEGLYGLSLVYQRAIALAWLSDDLWKHVPTKERVHLRNTLEQPGSTIAKFDLVKRIFDHQKLKQPLRSMTDGDPDTLIDLLLFRHRLENDAEKTLEQYFNYKHPLAEDLVFTSPANPEAGWDETERRWVSLPLTDIVISFPQCPTEIYDQAIALAAYNDSGPGYLFSCC